MSAEQEIPPGWIKDAMGRLVRQEAVPVQDSMRDKLVRDIVAGAKFRAANLKAWRMSVLGDVQAFTEVVAEKYKARIGKGQNITLNSYDGSLRVMIVRDNKVTFNEQLAVAKTMIWKCVERWTDGSRSEIRALVDAAFKTSRTGQMSVSKILALRQVEIDDPEWLRAMDALTDSLQVVGSATYIRVYERDSAGAMSRIDLDVFPEEVRKSEEQGAGSGEQGGPGYQVPFEGNVENGDLIVQGNDGKLRVADRQEGGES